MIYFPSFNHLICPEPGCDYVSEQRQDISRHMISDHMSEENTNASLKLFFCPTCSQNLELKSKENFQQHLNLCSHISTKDNEGTLPSKALVSERVFLEKRSKTNDVIINISGATEDLEEIKCHLCEFSLLDTEPLHGKNNGRWQMRQHYRIIHKIRHMRLCEKRGCDFRSASFKLNRKHRREEAGHSQCEECGVQILTERLEIHKKQVHSDLTFDCEYCNRPYGNAGHLK